jgi:hypothetical protein
MGSEQGKDYDCDKADGHHKDDPKDDHEDYPAEEATEARRQEDATEEREGFY